MSLRVNFLCLGSQSWSSFSDQHEARRPPGRGLRRSTPGDGRGQRKLHRRGQRVGQGSWPVHFSSFKDSLANIGHV